MALEVPMTLWEPANRNINCGIYIYKFMGWHKTSHTNGHNLCRPHVTDFLSM